MEVSAAVLIKFLTSQSLMFTMRCSNFQVVSSLAGPPEAFWHAHALCSVGPMRTRLVKQHLLYRFKIIIVSDHVVGAD